MHCCERGSHFVLAYRLYEWKKAVIVDPLAIAAKLEELADRGGVGLTPTRRYHRSRPRGGRRGQWRHRTNVGKR
jgi:hypothetical protein